jgi:hypothetical protein
VQDSIKEKLVEAEQLSALAEQVTDSTLAIGKALDSLQSAAASSAHCAKLKDQARNGNAEASAARCSAADMCQQLEDAQQQLKEAHLELAEAKRSEDDVAAARAALHVQRLEDSCQRLQTTQREASHEAAMAIAAATSAEQRLRSVLAEAAATGAVQAVITRLMAAQVQDAMHHNDNHMRQQASREAAKQAEAAQCRCDDLQRAANASKQQAHSLQAAKQADDALVAMIAAIQGEHNAASAAADAQRLRASAAAHLRAAEDCQARIQEVQAQRSLLAQHQRVLVSLHSADHAALRAQQAVQNAEPSDAQSSTLQKQAAALQLAADWWRQVEAACTVCGDRLAACHVQRANVRQAKHTLGTVKSELQKLQWHSALTGDDKAGSDAAQPPHGPAASLLQKCPTRHASPASEPCHKLAEKAAAAVQHAQDRLNELQQHCRDAQRHSDVSEREQLLLQRCAVHADEHCSWEQKYLQHAQDTKHCQQHITMLQAEAQVRTSLNRHVLVWFLRCSGVVDTLQLVAARHRLCHT